MRSQDWRRNCRPFNRCMWQGSATFVAAALLAPGALAGEADTINGMRHTVNPCLSTWPPVCELGVSIDGLNHGQKLSGTKVEYRILEVDDLVATTGYTAVPISVEVRQNLPGDPILMQESITPISLSSDIPPACQDAECIRFDDSIAMPRFRFSAAAYNDQDPILITVKIRFVIHNITQVHHPTGNYHVVGHPDGTSSGYLDYEHNFDVNPPIAWNKVQLAGTKYNSWTHESTDDTFAEGSTELVTAAIGHFDTHAKLPASASAALEVTRSEFLDTITESTAFAALVHGSVSSVVAPEPDTPGGRRSVSFLYDGSGTDFQKSVNDKAAEGIPQHYFAGFWSCNVLGHADPAKKPYVYTA